MIIWGRNKLPVMYWPQDPASQRLHEDHKRTGYYGLQAFNSLFLIINKSHFRTLPWPCFTFELHTAFQLPYRFLREWFLPAAFIPSQSDFLHHHFPINSFFKIIPSLLAANHSCMSHCPSPVCWSQPCFLPHKARSPLGPVTLILPSISPSRFASTVQA